MKNKVWLLAKIQLMRVWNPEFFKDRGLRKKRKRFLLLSLGMVGIGALIMFYSALISLGFVQMGMGGSHSCCDDGNMFSSPHCDFLYEKWRHAVWRKKF